MDGTKQDLTHTNSDSDDELDLVETSIDRATSSSLPTVEEIKAQHHVNNAAKNGSSSSNRGRWFWSCTGCLMLVLVALCIGLGIGLARRRRGNSHWSRGSNSIIDDSQQRQASDAAIATYLSQNGVSNIKDIRAAGSPQYQAVEWLAQHDGLNLPVPSGNILTPQGYAFVARYVMALHYFANGGPSWLLQYNFLSDRDICYWTGLVYSTGGQLLRTGVLCDDSTGVTDFWAFYNDFNQVSGTIPTEFGVLTSLEVLDLNANDLTGSIPTEICQLTSTRKFALAYNYLNGTMPGCLGQLSDTEILVLSENLLTGELPDLAPMHETLKTLQLDDNFMKGDITTQLNSLTNLRYLYTEDNGFTGRLDDQFLDNADWIRHIDMSGNFLTGTLSANLFRKAFLQLVDLHGNELSEKLPASMVLNPSVAYLALHENWLTGPIPSSLLNLTSLFHLDLANNLLTGTMPPELGQLPLNYLYLANNSFTAGPIPSTYAHLTMLQELNLKSTHRTGTLPEELGKLSYLQLLDFDQNALTGIIPASFGNLTRLEILLLNRNPLSGSLPTSFTSMTNLRAAYFEQTNLTGSLAPLCNLSNFNEDPGDGDGTEILAADCGGSNPEVLCTCCTLCCTDGTDCHNDEYVASLDPQWETGFARVEYDLGNDTRFIDRYFIDSSYVVDDDGSS